MKSNRFEFEDLYKEEIPVDPKAVQERLDAITKAATACLNSSLFAKYKEQFVLAQSGIVDAMINFNNNFEGSNDLYVRRISRYLQKLQDIKILLNQVELDALRVKQPKQEQENGKESKV